MAAGKKTPFFIPASPLFRNGQEGYPDSPSKQDYIISAYPAMGVLIVKTLFVARIHPAIPFL